jgi:GTP-binding protein HflX
MEEHNEKMKALLIGVCLLDEDITAKNASMGELERLVDTAGITTSGKYIQRKDRKNARTYAGEGFIERCLIKEEVDILIFDNDLTGSQARNIERLFSVEAIDRTEVILRIFHNRARTKEAKLQVRLAELRYELPRLKSMWTHLDRERFGSRMGAGVAFRGMGEKQSEKDRQKLQREIYVIEKRLGKIIKRIDTQKKRRKRNCRNIGLVGYTNAGKSTLFNRLTDSKVLVEDKLFATLDSTTRSLDLGKGRDVVISDTVGFISNLPHHLIASFRATLREAEEADLLLNITDISDDDFEKHINDVGNVLEKIGADGIPQLLLFNKTDLVSGPVVERVKKDYPGAQLISAKRGENLEELLHQIDKSLNVPRKYKLSVPQTHQKAINYTHNWGRILEKEYVDGCVKMTVEMGSAEIRKLEEYVV